MTVHEKDKFITKKNAQHILLSFYTDKKKCCFLAKLFTHIEYGFEDSLVIFVI